MKRMRLAGFFGLLLIIGITAFLWKPAHNLKVNSLRAGGLPKNDSFQKEFDNWKELFGGYDPLLIGVETNNHQGIFNKETLEIVRNITYEVEKLEGFARVLSPANFRNIKNSPEGMLMFDFLISEGELNVEEIKKDAKRHPVLWGSLISQDAKKAVVMVELATVSTGQGYDEERLLSQLLALQKKYTSEQNKIHISGTPYLRGELNKELLYAGEKIFWLSVITGSSVGMFFFGFFGGAIIGVTIFITKIWVYGITQVLGLEINVLHSTAPAILTAVVASSVLQFIWRYIERERIESAIKETIRPIFLSIATTAIGFATLIPCPIKSVSDYSLFITLGTGISLILVFILPVVFIGCWQRGFERKIIITPKIIYWFLDKCLFLSKKPKKMIFGVMGVVFGLSILSIVFWVQNYSRPSDFFPYSHPLRVSERWFKDNFGANARLDMVIEAPEQIIFKPEFLKNLETLKEKTKNHFSIGAVIGIDDLLKMLHREVMEEGVLTGYRLPSSQEEAIQLLTIFTASNITERYMERSYQAGNTEFWLLADDTRSIRNLYQWLQKNSEPLKKMGAKVSFGGDWYLFQAEEPYYVRWKISSGLTSILMAFALCAIILRSFKLGAFCTIPSMFTTVFIFGGMGLTGIPFQISTATVSCVVIGMGIDPAVHYLSRFLIERDLERAHFEIGLSLIGYVGLMVLAFLPLLIPQFFPMLPMRQLGMLIILSLLTNLVVALICIPNLLKLNLKRR